VFSGPPTEIIHSAVPLVPSYVRACGGVRVRFAASAGRTQAVERAESGGYRVRFPRIAETCEAVLINTGGGMAGGDQMRAEISLDAGAAAIVTTQAAEKIYRSQGALAGIGIDLKLAGASRLEWLPQEMILFCGSRWRRSLAADIAAAASLTIAESIVFGRIAMNEIVERGFCHDRWRIRRDGKLIFAEDMRLDGNPAGLLAAKASGNGARALATILHVAPNSEQRLDEARDLLQQASSECGASAWNGMLLVRLLSRDPQALRADLVRFLEGFRRTPMPRSWG
ncbi:MAG: urease accessory protein, partial [Methylobacteriaceae bacterium]|nr:urease accessory protein [Methylobacteriaceae bacterium]